MDIEHIIAGSVAAFLSNQSGTTVRAEDVQIAPTRKEFEGNLTVVTFPFLRITRKSPEQTGEMIGTHLVEALDEIEKFQVVKGFLNLTLSSEWFHNQLQSVLNRPKLVMPVEGPEQILVEFSSPNTNKPLHLGHLRNNFLGDSVSAILQAAGHEVVRTQIINDRGVHICKSMLAWQKFGNGETPESSGKKGDHLVGEYYVKYDQAYRSQVEELVASGRPKEAAGKEAGLAREVQQMLKKWEEGDTETRALWSRMNGWVYEGFDKTYDRMEIRFDRLYYESETFSLGKEIVLEGLKRGVFYQKEDGSIWCDLTEDGLDHKLLVRADGTTVYMTQDIGTAVQRFRDYPGLARVIYTVGDEQDYHFKVLFFILAKLGFGWAEKCRHLSYGMVDLPSGKMKSREGTVVDADELMQEVADAAKAAAQERGKLEEIAESEWATLYETLGIGALKYFLLRVDPRKRMMFNPQESVALNGDTGPFIQYTYARCKAVLRKAETTGPAPVAAELDEKEKALLQTLFAFSTNVHQAAQELNPAHVAAYCLETAKLYNQFYYDHPILKAEDGLKQMRLMVTELTAKTLLEGMAMLGIRMPERM